MGVVENVAVMFEGDLDALIPGDELVEGAAEFAESGDGRHLAAVDYIYKGARYACLRGGRAASRRGPARRSGSVLTPRSLR